MLNFPKYRVKKFSDSVELYPIFKRIKGVALVSYLKHPLEVPLSSDAFHKHSNSWESRKIAEWFVQKGFKVIVIDYNNTFYTPKVPISILFDIYTNLTRLEKFVIDGGLKILHLTGSDPVYQNAAETMRLNNLFQRKLKLLKSRRQVDAVAEFRRSMEDADSCTLIGNEHTLSTYPTEIQQKIELVTVSASSPIFIKKSEYVPEAKEFLWYFGGGAVHKGLDLLLEVFAATPSMTLNIVGNIEAEDDFYSLFKRELCELPNIKYWGFLEAGSSHFKEVVSRCFCFIAPSCSESISTAVATCLQVGLYPIISKDTGVMLPLGAGKTLVTCSKEEISEAITEVYEKKQEDLEIAIKVSQSFAMENFSREAFLNRISCAFARITSRQVNN